MPRHTGAATVISGLVLACSITPGHAIEGVHYELKGFASLPAGTFEGEPWSSGNFVGGSSQFPSPFPSQPVQGLSGVLAKGNGDYLFLSDNGYGAKANSADYALGIYDLTPDFKTAHGGTGTVAINGVVRLSDPNQLFGHPVVADMANYPGSSIPVAEAIRTNRYLTGWDMDVESIRKDAAGNIWIGDEFGPFLAKFSPQGELLAAPVAPAGRVGPDSPTGAPATIPGSGGFEGNSSTLDGSKFFAMLEKPTLADQAAGNRVLEVHEFDPQSGAYSGTILHYGLSESASAIGDFAPVTDQTHLVIERDGGHGESAVFKQIYLTDITQTDTEGHLLKEMLVDLMNIPDPHDLNGDGETTFTFPFVTIEDVVVVDDYTILVANDNNFPAANGRTAGLADNNELILIGFDQPLSSLQPAPVPVPAAGWLLGSALAGFVRVAMRKRR